MKTNFSDPNRRQFLGLTAGGVVMMAAGRAAAIEIKPKGHKTMNPGAFVYTELQISVPFDKVPVDRVNAAIIAQPGFLNKTWLSGYGSGSAGGFYSFDTIENAQKFVTDYFPKEAAGFGVAQTTRVFDGAVTRDASLGLNSVHYGTVPDREPGAYVYTEIQVSVPFDQLPWQDRNAVLAKQPGLISKTWLSGLHTQTVGGIDAFDTLEDAREFAVNAFPETAKKMNAAFYTRVFEAGVTRDASIAMNSPYFSI